MRHIWLPNNWLEWTPFAFAVVISLYVASTCSFQTKQPIAIMQEGFNPVTSEPFRLITPPPYAPGEVISVRNGLCNNGPVPLSYDVTLGIQEVGDITADNVEVLVARDRPLPLGCSIETRRALTGPLPPAVTPGRWYIYASIDVKGPQGQIQSFTILSPEFDVR